MSKYLISDTILQDTADSLRAKLETQAKIKPSEFASKIDDIVTNTGAFQVKTIQEMNAITDMDNGDYCIVEQQVTNTLPSGYTQVGYLECTGTQYIDTGAFISTATTYLDFRVVGDVINVPTFYGVYDNTIYPDRFVSYTPLRVSRRYWYYQSTRSGTSGRGTVDKERHTFLFNDTDNKVYFDDTLIRTFDPSNPSNNVNFTGVSPSTLKLFGSSSNTSQGLTITNAFGLRIYAFKLWDRTNNNALVRDLKPCVRDTDNVPGMYDVVNDVFYPSATTSNFLYGHDVSIFQYDTTDGWVDITVYAGIDTSDATALAADIKTGKTAYVDGTQITGTLPEVINPTSITSKSDGSFFKPDDAVGTGSTNGSYLVTDTQGQHVGTEYLVNWVKVTNLQTWYIQNQQKVKVGMPVSDIANTIGLTAENIKKGVTILGITGTYEGIVPEDEYDYQLETAKDIAGIQEQGGDE